MGKVAPTDMVGVYDTANRQNAPALLSCSSAPTVNQIESKCSVEAPTKLVLHPRATAADVLI